jgi:hypothetical protein
MAYSQAWNEAAPTDSSAANLLGLDIRVDKIAVRERIDSIFGTSIGAGNSWTSGVDPYKPVQMVIGLDIVPTTALASYVNVGIWGTGTAGQSPRIITIGQSAQSFLGIRYNGTSAAPTAVLSGNALALFGSGGYNGINWFSALSGMSINATENWSGTNLGTQIVFTNTLKTSTTVSTALILDTISLGHYAIFSGQVIAATQPVFTAPTPAFAAITQAGFVYGYSVGRITDSINRAVITEFGILFGPGGVGALDVSITRTGPAALSNVGTFTVTGLLVSSTANPASTGVVRLANVDSAGVVFRNAANNADITALGIGASNALVIGQGTTTLIGGTAATSAVAISSSGNAITTPDSTYLQMGQTNIPAVGLFRIPHNVIVLGGRNSTNSADNILITYGAVAANELNLYGAIRTTGPTALGFYNTAPIAKPTLTGAKSGNAALASVCTQLAALGLVTDSTT